MTTIATPSPTELSAPSPTEHQNRQNELSNDEMSRSVVQHQRPIYLIVATAISPPLGIGKKGNLPWSQIRSDMAFFKKVTSAAASTLSASRNAVIMGRKTWDSIPPRFRPLSDRVNVVLTRADHHGCTNLARQIKDELERRSADIKSPSTWTLQDTKPAMGDSSSGSAMAQVFRSDVNQLPDVIVTNSLQAATSLDERHGVSGLFCIGGAEIYGMVLKDQDLRPRVRVLQTLVRKEDGSAFECDTFWPETMETGVNGWTEVETEFVKNWVGINLPQGQVDWCKDEKAAVEIRVVGWEVE